MTTWVEQMEATIAQTERAARTFAAWGEIDEAVEFQREAEALRDELVRGAR